MNVMSFWLLAALSLLSEGLVGVILLLRENQHARIQKELLDRLLTSEGYQAIPEIHPVADLLAAKPDTAERIEKVIKELARKRKQGQRVRFDIPGLHAPNSGMGEIK